MRRFVYLTRTIAFSLVVPPPSEHYLSKRGKAFARCSLKTLRALSFKVANTRRLRFRARLCDGSREVRLEPTTSD